MGESVSAFDKFVGHIRFNYEMDEIWQAGNPNHKHHSNLMIRRGGKTLVTLCLRKGYFIVAIVFGKDERDAFEQKRGDFSETVQKEFDAAETLHDGKWMGFDVGDTGIVSEIIPMLEIKRKPNRKELPIDISKCVGLDLGLSKEEVTKLVMN